LTIAPEKNSETILLADNNKVEPDLESSVVNIYKIIESHSTSMPRLESFTQALAGFNDLKAKGLVSKNILTVIDFSLSSTVERLWIIDLTTNTVLLHSLVSHGMKSGLAFATNFSNAQNSHKSSLGFYATGESYIGKHGLSLRLDGLEKGTNNNARARGVVIHGTNYSNPLFLQSQTYLGRSQGCPAVPEKLSATIIKMIKDKSCLFIYHPSRDLNMAAKLI
jgi:hypothetical protein